MRTAVDKAGAIGRAATRVTDRITGRGSEAARIAEIAATWDPWLPVAQRAASLGWPGPFDPTQWKVLTATHMPSQPLPPYPPSPEERQIDALFGDRIAAAELRVDHEMRRWTDAGSAMVTARHAAGVAASGLRGAARAWAREKAKDREEAAVRSLRHAAEDLERARVALTGLLLRQTAPPTFARNGQVDPDLPDEIVSNERPPRGGLTGAHARQRGVTQRTPARSSAAGSVMSQRPAQLPLCGPPPSCAAAAGAGGRPNAAAAAASSSGRTRV